MAKKYKGVSAVVAFIITLVPLLFGIAVTGQSVNIVPSVAINSVIGWILIIAGLFSIYMFFTHR